MVICRKSLNLVAVMKPFTSKPKSKPNTQVKTSTHEPKVAAVKPEPVGLHPNNPHRGRYDMKALIAALPELSAFIITTPKGEQSVDFSNPKAVVCLNRALLKQHYGINNWSLAEGFLCPPIPGRADYVHHAADLLNNRPVSRQDQPVRMLDIGTGANLIYPMIASQAFGWQVVGSDINQQALQHAQGIIAANEQLHSIQLGLQNRPEQVFKGVIAADEYFDLTMCNPPFFKSAEEANKQAERKWRNLKGLPKSKQRNFGGMQQELWCEGGEVAFLMRMVNESVGFARQVGWFTTLVANHEHLPVLRKALRKLNAAEVKVVVMAQGQKRSHLLAWRFEV